MRCRRQWRPPDRATCGGPPRYREPLHPKSGRPCPVGPRRVGRPSLPLQTTEVQIDEKWSYVAKKEDHCDRSDPADDPKGDYWDHVAFDPDHHLVVAVVPGARNTESTEALVDDFRERTEGRIMRLMTSDGYPAYETAILGAYGETVTPPRTGKPGRPKGTYKVSPASLVYARVEKKKAKGRVVWSCFSPVASSFPTRMTNGVLQ